MLKKIIFAFMPLVVMASWEEVAVKGFDVMISANVGDSENFKSSLNSLIERAANEYQKSGMQDYELDLPTYITNRADKRSGAVQSMRHVLTKKLSPATTPLKSLMQSKINAMNETDTKAVMSGDVTLAHYIRANAFDEIFVILRPFVAEIYSDSTFAASYKSAMGSDMSANFTNEFTSAFINDAFDKLVQNEKEFRSNTNAVFNVIKTIH